MHRSRSLQCLHPLKRTVVFGTEDAELLSKPKAEPKGFKPWAVTVCLSLGIFTLYMRFSMDPTFKINFLSLV